MAEVQLIELPIFKQAQLLTQLADQRRLAIRYRQIMRRPRIRRDFVLAPARIAARPALHLDDREVAEAFLVEPPCRRQAGDPAAYDQYRHADLLARSGELLVVPQLVPKQVRVVDDA